MKRFLYDKLLKWKNNKNKKPLLLQGARQVGKTYLILEFAKREYQDFIYLNFEEEPELKTIFTKSFNPHEILKNISLYTSKRIIPERTLLIFDEIQAIPNAITSLKYFCEKANNIHLISAGSLLGVKVGKEKGFPVGKVNFLTLYPMNFYEFLHAVNEDLVVEELININDIKPFTELIHNKLNDLLKIYLILGGMPEVIKTYITKNDIQESIEIQKDILESYKRDFSKYSDRNLFSKISLIWNSIPYQLARENKKFKYKDVEKRARGSTYLHPLEWLIGAGLINMVYNVKKGYLPLKAYIDVNKFKIYFNDTGLLGAMLNIPSKLIIKPNAIFSEYNGAFIENFVQQELISVNFNELFYWTSKSDAEVDFVVQYENEIIPIEVKSGMNRNIKSLRSYEEKFKPKYLFRISPRNFYKNDNFINIPLYATESIRNILEKLI